LGAAVVILFAIGLSKKDRVAEQTSSFGFLAKIIAFCLIGHLGLTAIDALPLLLGSSVKNQIQAESLFGRYGGLLVLEILLLAAAAAMFLSKRFNQYYKPLLLSGALVVLGVFVNKILMLMAAFNAIPLSLEVDGAGLWSMPVSTGVFASRTDSFVTFWGYLPTLTELGVSLLPLSAALLIIAGLNNYLLKKGSEAGSEMESEGKPKQDLDNKVVYRIPRLIRIPPNRDNP
ncbi:MAG: hypothetical protein LBB49_03255, partial [Gracilibacteraceae bacterium]|nr:hypothetical protein [Gracilibacteraceae bacterium]